MSEYLLAKYGQDVAALLTAHGLTVPDQTRELLADKIGSCREQLADDHEATATTSARQAAGYVRKLLDYKVKPPSRAESVPNLCKKLASTLLNGPLAIDLGLSESYPASDFVALLEALEGGSPDTQSLQLLDDALSAVIAQSSGKQCGGRPWGSKRAIVRAGLVAWLRAGRTIRDYTWDAANEELTGALPEFLFALLAACGLAMSPVALNQAIRKDMDELQNYVDSHTG